ncbi:MAG TPA: hypothetical protein VK453_05655 [Micromonosporaceae bacterium]|nr:hypothetical protein [Micromonosporaceae bacterium]
MTVGASWLGIRSVLVATVPGQALPLSAADLRSVVPTTPAPESPSPSPSPTESVAPTEVPSPSVSAAPPTSKPAPTPTPEIWVASPDGKGGTAFKRTFRTSGGDVVILAARGDVKVLSNAPKAGFTVKMSRAAPDNVTVTFAAPRRVARVSARWANGPYAEVGEVTGFGQ